jgi:hypothetical protein
MASSPESPGGFWHVWNAYPAVRIAAVVLSIAFAAAVAWLVFLRPGSSSGIAEAGGGPVGTSQADLAALSMRLGEPVYWAGPQARTRLEATLTANEYAYVRYLSGSAPIGDGSPMFLTVATYPAMNALTNLRSYAASEHASWTRIPGGGIAVPVPGSTTSVYFARPNHDLQIEVYDPQEGQALHLIKSGAIQPVPGGANPAQKRPGS